KLSKRLPFEPWKHLPRSRHGPGWRSTRGAGSRLADRHARWGKSSGSPVPALAGSGTLHALAPKRLGKSGHRASENAYQFFAALSGSAQLLPLLAATHAPGSALAVACLRPGHQLQPLRGQVGHGAPRRSPRLLLLHAHALRLAHAFGL